LGALFPVFVITGRPRIDTSDVGGMQDNEHIQPTLWLSTENRQFKHSLLNQLIYTVADYDIYGRRQR